MSDEMSFCDDLPEWAIADDWAAPNPEMVALDVVSEVNDEDELTIYPADGATTTEWLTSDLFFEVVR